MSSASLAEGGLISETSYCAVCLGWRPAYPSVKAVSQRIKVAAPHSGPFVHSRMSLYQGMKGELRLLDKKNKQTA